MVEHDIRTLFFNLK